MSSSQTRRRQPYTRQQWQTLMPTDLPIGVNPHIMMQNKRSFSAVFIGASPHLVQFTTFVIVTSNNKKFSV
jgi:hypothetical protein